MFTLRSSQRALLTLGMAAATACGEATAPAEIGAEYALVSVAGSALPSAPFAGSSTLVFGDTIRLRTDGTGERVWVWREGPGGSMHHDVDRLTWQSIGDSLAVSFPCDDMVLMSCIAPPHLAGRLQAGMQWIIPHATIYNAEPAVYQRVGMR